jgi:hypothetical protein
MVIDMSDVNKCCKVRVCIIARFRRQQHTKYSVCIFRYVCVCARVCACDFSSCKGVIACKMSPLGCDVMSNCKQLLMIRRNVMPSSSRYRSHRMSNIETLWRLTKIY